MILYCNHSLCTFNGMGRGSDGGRTNTNQNLANILLSLIQGSEYKLRASGTGQSNREDESQSWSSRCLVSLVHTVTQQLVTPVSQSRCIGPTVVNINDNDEWLVTNKQHSAVMGKADPTQISDHSTWLSSTFSKIVTNVFRSTDAGKAVTDKTIHVLTTQT